jgi:hypothetical protein
MTKKTAESLLKPGRPRTDLGRAIMHAALKLDLDGLELRNHSLFAVIRQTVKATKAIIEAWRREYNESRPHRAHGERTPHEIAGEFAASREFSSTITAGDSLSG